jgi:hypothetical protein
MLNIMLKKIIFEKLTNLQKTDYYLKFYDFKIVKTDNQFPDAG